MNHEFQHELNFEARILRNLKVFLANGVENLEDEKNYERLLQLLNLLEDNQTLYLFAKYVQLADVEKNKNGESTLSVASDERLRKHLKLETSSFNNLKKETAIKLHELFQEFKQEWLQKDLSQLNDEFNSEHQAFTNLLRGLHHDE